MEYVHQAQYYETDQMGIIHHSNYIRWMEEARIAYMDEMDFPSGELEDDRRAGYQELAERIGEEALHALLAERDPESAAVIHPHNVRRVIRALEMHDNGVSYAQQVFRASIIMLYGLV